MQRVQAKPGVQLMVLAGDHSQQISGGAIVDLDEIVVQARGTRPAETLADVLGPHVSAFEPIAESTTTASVSFVSHAAAPASEE